MRKLTFILILAVAFIGCKKEKNSNETTLDERKIAFEAFVQTKLDSQSELNKKKQKIISQRNQLLRDLRNATTRRDSLTLLIGFENYAKSICPEKINKQQPKNLNYRIDHDDLNNPYYEIYYGDIEFVDEPFPGAEMYIWDWGYDENGDPYIEAYWTVVRHIWYAWELTSRYKITYEYINGEINIKQATHVGDGLQGFHPSISWERDVNGCYTEKYKFSPENSTDKCFTDKILGRLVTSVYMPLLSRPVDKQFISCF